MATISKKALKAFTDKIFGTDEEIQEGMRSNVLQQSVMVEGILFSKGKWSVEKVE